MRAYGYGSDSTGLVTRLLFICGFLLSLSLSTTAHEGLHLLFNGRDLTGWINVNGYADSWRVRDGMLMTTGLPFGFLRTDRMYENFILEFDWQHQPRIDGREGNSGLFVWADPVPALKQGSFPRAIEVQILVNFEQRDQKTGVLTATSNGDIFSIQGATCIPYRPHPLGWSRSLPTENRVKGFGHWNHYRVIAIDGVIKLGVNGKEVSEVTDCMPRKGYLALESEGNPIFFRNLRIKELPGSNPAPDAVAMDGGGWRPLYNRRDLSGWKVESGAEGHWQPNDWRIVYDGRSQAEDKNLWTTKDYQNFELIVDWRLTGQPKKRMVPVVLPNGENEKDGNGKDKQIEINDYGDSGIYLRGSSKSQVNIWCWPIGSGEVYGYRTDKMMSPEVRAAVTPKYNADAKPGEWNRFHITLKGDRLTVVLNGHTVIENAQLPGIPERGPIALQHHGDPVDFANIYIRELPQK